MGMPKNHLNTMNLDFFRENREFVCGWGSAVVNILVTFPINKIIFRQMLHNCSIMSATRQISAEGMVHLYRGVLPPLFQKSVSLSIMFGMYDKCQKPLKSVGLSNFSAKTLAAIFAGTFESVLVPFERLQTLLQHEKFHRELQNMRHACEVLWRQHGMAEFYRGLVPILYRNGPSNAMFFLLRDEAQERLPSPSSVAGRIAREFAVGALIGAMCSTVFYPCNVLKVHMQARIGGPFQSVSSAVREIIADRGTVGALFRGVHLNYTRSCISWGVINVAYDSLKSILEYPPSPLPALPVSSSADQG